MEIHEGDQEEAHEGIEEEEREAGGKPQVRQCGGERGESPPFVRSPGPPIDIQPKASRFRSIQKAHLALVQPDAFRLRAVVYDHLSVVQGELHHAFHGDGVLEIGGLWLLERLLDLVVKLAGTAAEIEDLTLVQPDTLARRAEIYESTLLGHDGLECGGFTFRAVHGHLEKKGDRCCFLSRYIPDHVLLGKDKPAYGTMLLLRAMNHGGIS